MMKPDMILMNAFTSEPPALREAMMNAAHRVVQSGWYVLGGEGQEFERKWAERIRVGHGVGVGNGMDAIEIALRALDVGLGDEVITTPMTAFATVLGILRSGATPVLADIETDTALLSIDSVKRCLSSSTRAVVLVHLYGQIRSPDQWRAFCDEAGIHLIEDCAQAHLASWQGSPAGSFGSAAAFSFYPTKNLGALGDAGMLMTNDGQIAAKAARLRNYGQSVRYEHPELGLNSRLDEIQAAILMERLNWLDEFTARRQGIAEKYFDHIQNPAIQHMARPVFRESHVFHLFAVRCQARDALIEHLYSKGVQSLIHYPVPVHHQAPCESILRDPEGLTSSELHADRCLSIPCHPQLTDQDVEQVIDAMNSFQRA